MNSTRAVLVMMLALLILTPTAFGRERGEDGLRGDMEFAKEQVYPALVNISVVVKNFSGGRSRRAPAAGSGVIVSPAGHVVTNFHVAGETTGGQLLEQHPTDVAAAHDSDLVEHCGSFRMAARAS